MSEINKNEAKDFKAKLEKACRGLIFISETDADVIPVFGERVVDPSSSAMLAAVSVAEGTSIAEAEPDRFFARLTTHKEWFGPHEKVNANGFAKLERLLKSELHDLKIFRLGKIKIDIYMIGIDSEGRVAGAKTHSVET